MNHYKQTYFSTFISGTGEIIERAMKKKSGKFHIVLLLDGLVVYETTYSERELRQIKFFNNTFLLFSLYKKLGPNPIEEMIKKEVKDSRLKLKIRNAHLPRRTTFKIVASIENQTVPVDRGLLKKLETKISNSGLILNTKKSDKDFWLLARSENIGLFGLRITYPYSKEKKPEKGELKKELAHILVLLSNPNPKDIVLDPFAGHGAIPLERATSFPYNEIIAVEKDPQLAKNLKSKAKQSKKKITVMRGDALNLENIKSEYVDKIITDPPWGIYKETDISLSEFYEKMLREFVRVLKQNGIAVVLIGSKEVFEESLNKFKKELNLLEKHDILVSGKKAGVYKIGKI